MLMKKLARSTIVLPLTLMLLVSLGACASSNGATGRRAALAQRSPQQIASVRGPATRVNDPSTSYTYDLVGRIATALYDNDTCTAYSYDANGNRTSSVTTNSGTPESNVWGTGSWGCFQWTAQ